MFELDNAYLQKVYRDARATQLAESIRKPGCHTYELMIDANDEDALALAIERSTPDQLAKWVIGLVVGAGGFEDDFVDEYDDLRRDTLLSATLGGTTDLVWRFIAAYVEQHGYPPTVREIASGCYLASSSSAWYHLRKLQEAGILQHEARSARNFRLVMERKREASRP